MTKSKINEILNEKVFVVENPNKEKTPNTM